ncbi:hypothetical protein DZK27_10340 [Rhodobacteraceae bacterium 63075]|nr:hypothetical protein DZK27_10340 [Rhodobacteraceae bacterium 63075]
MLEECLDETCAQDIEGTMSRIFSACCDDQIALKMRNVDRNNIKHLPFVDRFSNVFGARSRLVCLTEPVSKWSLGG